VDRTYEFRQIVLELSRKAGGTSVPGVDRPVPQLQSEQNIYSAEIGSEINQASVKVAELRKLSKAKGIFNDRTSEIQELISSVKQHIQKLGNQIEALEMKAKCAGPNRASQAHSSNMVETLKTRLLGVTKDFQDALEARTQTLEHQESRRKLYLPGQGAASNRMPLAHRPTRNPEDLEGGGTGNAQSATLAYANSRAETVQSVQKTMTELAQIFKSFAVMVSAQEEMIQRIDHDIDETLGNTEKAQDNLLKYLHHISSNRWFIIKVFLILIFFVLFFVVFLA